MSMQQRPSYYIGLSSSPYRIGINILIHKPDVLSPCFKDNLPGKALPTQNSPSQLTANGASSPVGSTVTSDKDKEAVVAGQHDIFNLIARAPRQCSGGRESLLLQPARCGQ
ncbi:MAG: hypothetical protein MZV63_35850 [Marinilabiliales bacterium]|nr:hypothetical protein [Marinilabiliales bacterium]